jgi:L-lysine 2,3-aminomutase
MIYCDDKWSRGNLENITNIKDLLGYLQLDISSAPYKIIENPSFPFLVPVSFAERMHKGDWYDPLLLQVLPRTEEALDREGFSDDAVGDREAQAAPGLLHKYESRVLLMASAACAVHCRFCFRRCHPVSSAIGEPAWRYIREHTEVNEAVLSGGDPLCLEAAALAGLLDRVASFPHIKTVRIHTRLPIVDPGRISQPVLELLSSINNRKNCVVVLHVNHANELNGDCPATLARLRAIGALLLSQTVLLRNVNDSAERLCDLSTALLDHGIVPYYLHQLDRVAGAWHFEVDEEKGKMIIKELREKLPGYAVPRYVREVAGEKFKRNI